MDFWHYPSKHSKRFGKKSCLQILICKAKDLAITQGKKEGGENGPFLSFATKCKCRAAYDLNVEAISVAIGRGCRSSQLI